MTKLQKIIKYLAIGFAIFLTISIVSGIVKAIALISGVSNLVGESSQTTETLEGTVYTDDIDSLKIDILAVDLKIQEGNEFSVETDSKYISSRQKNGVLIVEEKKHSFISVGNVGSLIITIPTEAELLKTEIQAGAGKIEIEALNTEELDFDLGAGKVTVYNLVVSREADIDGGAGDITFEHASINNLDMDMGVGELSMEAKITGKSDIDFGVGSAKITLEGSLEDYRICMNKGIGEATLDGEKMRNEVYYGEGKHLIEMDGGVGEVKIVFQKDITI